MDYKKEQQAKFADAREQMALMCGLWFTILTMLVVVIENQVGMSLASTLAKTISVGGVAVGFGMFRAYDVDGYARIVAKEFTDYDFSIHDIERP